jgi:N,N'-diacetyllegionaminate synthase
VNVLDEIRSRYGTPTGLSDHSATVFPAMWALAHGADLIEVHVTFDRAMYGPDTKASLTFQELATVCAANRAFETFRGHPVDKNAMAEELSQMRELFTKSVAVRHALGAGHTLTVADLTVKKPGTGIPADRLDALVGRRLARDAAPDRVLQWTDLEDGG